MLFEPVRYGATFLTVLKLTHSGMIEFRAGSDIVRGLNLAAP